MTGTAALVKILERFEDLVEENRKQTKLMETAINSQKGAPADQNNRTAQSVPKKIAYPEEIYSACYSRP